MKASIFIQTALIDQMQQIADIGLWFHLSRLIPSGVELLARVTERNENDGYLLSEKNPQNLAIPDWIDMLVIDVYKKLFPKKYVGIFPKTSGFFSANPQFWLVSDDESAEKHLWLYGGEQEDRVRVLHQFYLHVPTWFSDFKAACQTVLGKIESGELQDIEVLKMKDSE